MPTWAVTGAAVAEEPELTLLREPAAVQAVVTVASVVVGSTGDPPRPLYIHYISGASVPAGVLLASATIAEDDLPVQRARNIILVNPVTDHSGTPCWALAADGDIPAPVPIARPLQLAGATPLAGAFSRSGVSAVSLPDAILKAYLTRADCPIDGAYNVRVVNADSGRPATHVAVASAYITWPMPVTVDRGSQPLSVTASPPVGPTTNSSPPAMSLTIAGGQLVVDLELPIIELGNLVSADNIILVNPETSS